MSQESQTSNPMSFLTERPELMAKLVGAAKIMRKGKDIQYKDYATFCSINSVDAASEDDFNQDPRGVVKTMVTNAIVTLIPASSGVSGEEVITIFEEASRSEKADIPLLVVRPLLKLFKVPENYIVLIQSTLM